MNWKLAWTLMYPEDSTGTLSSGSGGGEGADTSNGSQGEDLEGTDKDVDWQQEASDIVDEDKGDEAPPPEDKGKKPEQEQQQQQQKKPDDDKTQQQQQQKAADDGKPKPDEKLGPDGKPVAKPEDDKSKEQKPQPDQQQQKDQESPEQKKQREEQRAQEAEKEHKRLVEYYKLPDDQAARLATEPEVVLPELAARLHQAVQQNVLTWAARTVPQIMLHAKAAEDANVKAQQAFEDHWPGLKGKHDQILQVGAMYRQMNPNATPEEALEKVGQLTCAALGIDPGTARKQGNGQQQPPQQRTVVQQRPPFRPAGAQSSQAGNAPAPDNPWAAEAEQILAEDREG